MKRYAVVIEKAAKNFGAYVPDLPGCVATGPTVEKTERLLREAIALHIQGIIEDGLTIPEPSSLVEYVELEASNTNASEERVEIVKRRPRSTRRRGSLVGRNRENCSFQ